MSPAPGFLQGLVLGQLVHHWQFGQGQVLRSDLVDGHETAWIDFGPRGVLTLRVRNARLIDPTAPPSARPRPGWEHLVDEAAPLHPAGRDPWVAWFGSAVVTDDAAFGGMLNEINGDLAVYPVGRYGAAAVGWPDVTVLIHPAPTHNRLRWPAAGVVVLSTAQGTCHLLALPLYSDWGHLHHVTPCRIRVCAGRVEAVVEADLHLGEETLPVAFAMPTFELGRVFLRQGQPVAVALTALAMACRPSAAQTFQLQHGREAKDALHRAGAQLICDPDGRSTYSTDGMSAWLPHADRPSFVDFRGRVVAVHAITLPPRSRAAWKLRLRAWNASGADWLLDVVFEASVWPVNSEPVVGSDVEGVAWLVGECLGPATS